MNWLKKIFGGHKSNIRESGADNVFVNVPAGLEVVVHGSGNRVEFASPGMAFSGRLEIGCPECPIRDVVFRVGEGTNCVSANFYIMENGCRILIGGDCMISWNVTFWGSDMHALLDASGRTVNRGRSIEIGDHVWIGCGAVILKNSRLGSGSVVGANAVVSGDCGVLEGSLVAGNPARLVKRGVVWDRRVPDLCDGVNTGG